MSVNLEQLYEEYKKDWITEHIDDITMTATMALYENTEEAQNMTFNEYVEEYGFDGGQIYSSFEEFIEEDLNEYTTWKDKLELSESSTLYFDRLDTSSGEPEPACTVMLEKDTNLAVIQYLGIDKDDVVFDLSDIQDSERFEATLEYYFEEYDWGFHTEDYSNIKNEEHIRPLAVNDIIAVETSEALVADAFREIDQPVLNVQLGLSDEGLDNIFKAIDFYNNENIKDFDEYLESSYQTAVEADILQDGSVYLEVLIEKPDGREYSELVPISLEEEKTIRSEVNKQMMLTYDQTVNEFINEDIEYHKNLKKEKSEKGVERD